MWLWACTYRSSPPPPNTPIIAPLVIYTCDDLDKAWGNDWAKVLEIIRILEADGTTCGAELLASKAYAAHFSYAAALEKAGNTDAATVAYQRAYELDPSRPEAINALGNLGHLPAPTPVACDGTPTPLDPASPLAIDPSLFMTVQGDQLILDGDPFVMRGVNYYPRHAPWHRFLESANPDEMAQELDLIAGAGFNTLRVFLRYDALFTCDPELTIPNDTTFALVDTLIALAKERNLRLLVTLNDLPDLRFRPLYTDWNRYDAQTIYIVRRYRNEPTILAWDLRNEADLDYGANRTTPSCDAG